MSQDPFKPVVLSLPNQLTSNLVVEVLPQGLTVHRIYVQTDGKTHDIIAGPERASDYASPVYKCRHTIIGRYTNRIPVKTLQLVHGTDPSITSTFTPIANESPTVSLHGGPVGFDTYAFQVLDGPDDSLLFSPAEKALLKSRDASSFALFKHVSPDGDQGFPGELLVEVLVGLSSPEDSQTSGRREEYDLGSLYLVYRSKVTGKGAKVVTPVNLTQHWGFNLDASLREGGHPTVKNHHLQIKADNIMELEPTLLASGKLLPVQGTAHDHQSSSADTLGSRYPSSGYDHFYLFSTLPKLATVAPGKVPLSSLTEPKFDLLSPIVSTPAANPPLVVLSSAKSGIKASFDTNQGGVQFWSCEPLTGEGNMKKIHGGSGEENGNLEGYRGGSAAFLEFHEPQAAYVYPDVVSKSISKNDTLLGSDELSHNYIKVDFSYKTPTSTTVDV